LTIAEPMAKIAIQLKTLNSFILVFLFLFY
jgi:hypothetical protein